MCTKLHDIKTSIVCCSYSVIILLETWLHAGIFDREYCDNTYLVFRKDRCPDNPSVRGGGVLIAVKRSFSTKMLNLDVKGREEIWVEINLGGINVILCAVYFPPNSLMQHYMHHVELVNYVVDTYKQHAVIIVGDYNLPHVIWKYNKKNETMYIFESNDLGTYLSDELLFCGFNQFNGICNDYNSILDLVFANQFFVKVSKCNSEILSWCDRYHPALNIDIDLTAWNGASYINNGNISAKKFKMAEYDKINSELKLVKWSELLSASNIDRCVESLYNVLYQLIDSYQT